MKTTKTKHWWRQPTLRRDEELEIEHKASWLELFFDLVFVAVISQLSHLLSHEISLYNVFKYLFLFVPVWWYWIGSTFYNERFATNDVSHRIFVFLQMIAVAGLAFYINDALGEKAQGFAISYIFARSILIVMWARGGLHNPQTRPLTTRYVIGFSLSVVLWTVSIFIPSPLRFILWGIGLFFDLCTPLTTLNIQKKLPKFSTSHLPERFGLFTIIVLGESIVGVILETAKNNVIQNRTWLHLLMSFILAFGLWWMYFDFIVGRRTKPKMIWLVLRGYLHLPLVQSCQIHMIRTISNSLRLFTHFTRLMDNGCLW